MTTGNSRISTPVSFLLCACLFWAGACAWAQQPLKPGFKQITDSAGRTVAIPIHPKRIAITCYGGATHEVAVLGEAGKIVAQPTMARFPFLLDIYPHFREVIDAGSFDNVNIEQLLSMRPDLILAPVTSPRANASMESMQIPVVEVLVGSAETEALLKEFEMMGRVLSRERQASELIQYWRARLDWLSQRLAKIPASERRRVLYMSSDGASGSISPRGWNHALVTLSGGLDMAATSQISGKVNTEQIIAWNPEVILLNGSTPSGNALESDPRLQKLRAVTAHAVYHSPVGAFWWDRPSPEAILGVFWLAKTLYPDHLRDLDLRAETRVFYRRFYGHKLSDSEYEAILHPHVAPGPPPKRGGASGERGLSR